MNTPRVAPAASDAYVLITGASRGLGRLFAMAFAKRGYHLVLVARSESELKAVADEARAATSCKVCLMCLDLTDPDAVDIVAKQTSGLALHGLVNNAGVGMGGAFAEMERQALRRMLVLNMVTTTELIRIFVPQLRQTRGFVINLASQASFQPIPFMAAYAASKAYVLHLTEALACELAPDRVHFLAVCPGPTKTDFFNVADIEVTRTHFRLAAPDEVIRCALAALDRKQVHIVPGLMTKIAAFSTRLFSRRFLARTTQKLMGH